MSEVSEAIQAKCLAFSDRIIKLNDYLLKEAANAKPTYKIVKGKRVYEKSVPVYLQSVSNLCNQLLRAGTSIGANNAEACNAISKADFKSKSFIALKEARESLYWIDLLHRNSYLDDKQYQSIYDDAEELVKIMVQSAIRIKNFSYLCPQNKRSIMIVTNQATDTKRNFNATSTRNRIMASTMSVDEYFDELIDKVREDYANL